MRAYELSPAQQLPTVCYDAKLLVTQASSTSPLDIQNLVGSTDKGLLGIASYEAPELCVKTHIIVY